MTKHSKIGTRRKARQTTAYAIATAKREHYVTACMAMKAIGRSSVIRARKLPDDPVPHFIPPLHTAAVEITAIGPVEVVDWGVRGTFKLTATSIPTVIVPPENGAKPLRH